MTEAMRHFFADRSENLGDPDFVKVPLTAMLVAATRLPSRPASSIFYLSLGASMRSISKLSAAPSKIALLASVLA